MRAFVRLLSVLLGLLLAASTQRSSAQDDTRAVDRWQASSALLDNFRITFAERFGPTESFAQQLRTTPPPAMFAGAFIPGSREIKLSKRGNEHRFDIVTRYAEEVSPRIPGQGAIAARSGRIVEIHGFRTFFYYDEASQSGGIRAAWPEMPFTPLDYVLFPEGARGRMTVASMDPPIVEVRSAKNTSMRRCTLDASGGWLPLKIEFMDLKQDGGTFLYRVFEVQQYERQANGAYLPLRCVVWDFAAKTEKGFTHEMEEHYHITSKELDVRLPDDEFTFAFPVGTRVTDYIVGTSYIVGRSPLPIEEPEKAATPEFPDGKSRATSAVKATDARVQDAPVQSRSTAARQPWWLSTGFWTALVCLLALATSIGVVIVLRRRKSPPAPGSRR